ncbi:hypothetical protein Clacol_006457 [Clathrus columnatus]|uniref:T-cell immunomodulatory protein n=1 Tax=Clathrus columnatus TaxID=1419009 RepID=A0AAV5AIA6_9AGAM|nr:hypothetical protein Clacol_006457 [Clathrus columnatus]
MSFLEKLIFKPSVSVRHSERIRNIVPGDYNNDGRLDLLVMSGNTEGANAISVYFSDLIGGFERPVQAPSSATAQPFLVDSNGDMKIDLLGTSPINNKLVLWKNIWNGTDPNNRVFNLTEPLFQGNTPCDISDPHSNAFIDLDGDCLADIFLTCQKPNSQQRTFQIWVNSAEQDNFVFKMSGQFPNGMGSITFADMDRDGTIDMVFPTCRSIDSQLGIGHKCSLNIVYNKQRPLCKSGSSAQDQGFCRTPNDLCTKDSDFQFDFSEDTSNEWFERIDLETAFGFDSLLMNDVTYDPPLPVTVRIGDLTLDGYPDIIVIGVSGSGNRSPYILNSIPCSHNIAGCDSRGNGRRGFKVVTAGTETVRRITDARGVAVMDLDEDV